MVARAALLVLLVALAGCLEPAAPPAPSGDAEAEAHGFGLQVISTFLAGDADAFLALVADEVYTLEGEGPFSRADVERVFASERPFPEGRDYRHFTLDDYNVTYAPEVWTFDEARERFPEFANVTWEGWTPDADDLIFYGSQVREGKTSFMWDDLLSFGVTRETGAWRFKAFTG